MHGDDSVVTDMAAVHLFHTTSNVTCTITDERYTLLSEQSVILAFLARRCDTTTMFMQYGAPPHIAHCVNQLFRHHLSIKI